MRKSTAAAVAILLSNLIPSAQAGDAMLAPAIHVRRPAAATPVSLVERGPMVTRGKIAECSNLAAIRALNAKASGADYPAQSRILDLTFVLCLAGTASEG